MGLDWIRRAKDKFRRRTQEAAKKNLGRKPLVAAPEEEITTTIACQWVEPEVTLPTDTEVLIFNRGDKARMAVMSGNDVVGEVRGEAASDLGRLFKSKPALCNVLRVSITQTGQGDEPFYVQPVKAKRGTAR